MSHHSVRDSDATITECRWVCPICGDTSLTLAEGEQQQAAVVQNLKTHIESTRDADHGDMYSFPDGFDTDTLTAHVELDVRSRAD